jgi:hypothetical protein
LKIFHLLSSIFKSIKVDFANFLLQQYEEFALMKGVTILNSQSGSFDFLEEEENLYSLDDLKEKFF